MQRLQSTHLSECATKVQNLEQTYQKQREARESLRDSRSCSFDQRPVHHTERNERLELLEELDRGPVQCQPPIDDPNFERLEPNAQVKLRRLGSSAEYTRDTSKPMMDGDYEVPLYGDWVLFAVMGEKSELKYTASAENTDSNGDPTRVTRKFFGCQLLDLNAKYVDTNRELPGHCFMRMLVFDNGPDANHFKSERSAFEKLWKERDGVLLAILNPKIMPSRKGLTITPRSSDSILVIGLAESYSHCCALKKNGKRCQAFVLRGRNDGVCHKHLEMAVATRQRSRMELATAKRVFTRGDLSGLDVGGTSLAGPTYVVSADHAPRHAGDPASQMYDITTKLGRHKEQKEQRKRKKENQDYLPFKKTDGPAKSREQGLTAAVNMSTAIKSGDDIDEKFLANLDQNNLAAKALSIAQATLRGESLHQRSHNAALATSAKKVQDDAAARVSRPETLPRANLRGSRPASNGSERGKTATKHKEFMNSNHTSNLDDNADYAEDDLIIVR
ncbi:hypothetical protein MCAP1_000386a, partial [Malassezia caprae]